MARRRMRAQECDAGLRRSRNSVCADDRVVAAVAERVAAQQPPAGQHGAAQYAVALDRLHRVRRAGRVVLAAARERRRDEALVEPDRGEHDRAASSRVAPPAPRAAHAVDELGQRAAHAAGSPRARPARARPDARRRRSPTRRAAARPPAQNASRSTRFTRVRSTAPPTRRDTESPRRGPSSGTRLLARERVEHEEPVGLRAALPVDALELGAARQPAPLGAATAARGAPPLDRQPLAALVAAALEHDAAGAGLMRARKPCVRARLRFLGW